MSALSARLGRAPRESNAELVDAFRLPSPPGWLDEQDALSVQYAQRDELMRSGEVALASIFMANAVLWEDGHEDAPAGIVYSFDPVVHRLPRRLVEVGMRLYDYHEAEEVPPRDPWERQLLDQLHTGFERPMHAPVPPELCRGHAVYHGSLMVIRDHLPGRRITGRLVPVLVARHLAGPRPAMIVPSTLWPDPLLARWRAGPEGEE